MPAGVKHTSLISPKISPDPELQRYHPNLEAELCECLAGIRHNEMLFNLEVEPDLVEQRIYERCALQCRYRYLLAQARKVGLRTILRPDEV